MPAGTPGDVEVDLDDAGAPAPGPRRSPSGRWGRAGWAAGGLVVGLLLGHAWLPAGTPDPPPPAAPAAGPPVRMVFGAGYDGYGDQVARTGRQVTVLVPALVVNETTAPVVVRALRVSGPGAGLAAADGFQQVVFPLHVAAGETIELPFRLTSDCDVPVRPVPRLTLVVGPDDGSAGRPVDVRIPGLDSLWGRTLEPSLCRG